MNSVLFAPQGKGGWELSQDSGEARLRRPLREQGRTVGQDLLLRHHLGLLDSGGIRFRAGQKPRLVVHRGIWHYITQQGLYADLIRRRRPSVKSWTTSSWPTSMESTPSSRRWQGPCLKTNGCWAIRNFVSRAASIAPSPWAKRTFSSPCEADDDDWNFVREGINKYGKLETSCTEIYIIPYQMRESILS